MFSRNPFSRITSIRNDVFVNISNNEDTVIVEYRSVRLYQKVQYAYRLLEDSGLLPNNDVKSKKNTNSAEEARKIGNKEFGRNQLSKALNSYSVSVRFSLPNSLELSLAYANRSAVLFEFDKFDLCLLDIQRALDIDYPDKLKYKLYLRKGKCLQKLGSYSEAKLSFQNARNYLRLAEFTHQVQEQRSTWETRLDQSIDECNESDQKITINSVKNFILPALPSRNSLIPNASEKIRINSSLEMGQYLTATQNIEPGEILATEKPYASILSPNHYHTHCSNCFIRNPAMIPCEKCAVLMFCNEKCRDEAWSNYHEIECEVILAFLSLGIDNMEFLAVRILMIATKQGTELRRLFNHPGFGAPIPHPSLSKSLNVGKAYVSESYGAVHLLEDHFKNEDRSKSDSLEKGLTAAILMNLLKGSTFFRVKAGVAAVHDDANDMYFFAGNLLLKYLCIVMCNGHPILELVKETPEQLSMLTNQNKVIGAALYPLLSLANHSCDPNVVRHNYHNNVVLRAIQPIAENEQIFDNYGFHYAWHDLSTRQTALKKQYLFNCTCVACTGKWASPRNLPSGERKYLSENPPKDELEKSSTSFRNTLVNIKQFELDGALESLCPYLSLLHNFIERPCKEYAECQEAIKECFAYQGNNYVPSKDGTIILPDVN